MDTVFGQVIREDRVQTNALANQRPDQPPRPWFPGMARQVAVSSEVLEAAHAVKTIARIKYAELPGHAVAKLCRREPNPASTCPAPALHATVCAREPVHLGGRAPFEHFVVKEALYQVATGNVFFIRVQISPPEGGPCAGMGGGSIRRVPLPAEPECILLRVFRRCGAACESALPHLRIAPPRP